MLISIILPVFNGQEYLAKSIESCLNQSYKEIELIIVNDCSSDHTLGIANRFADEDNRVKIINNRENRKLPTTLNIGHLEAKGALITWTSDDNIYQLNAIEELLKPFLSEEVDIVYSDFSLIDKQGDFKKEILLPEVENLIFGNCIGASFMYKREVYERNGGYNENLFLVEDFDFWIRAFQHSKYMHLKKSLYKYRTHHGSLTSGIKFNKETQKLWIENCNLLYSNFFSSYIDNYDTVADIFTNKLTGAHIDFSNIIKENKKFNLLKDKLKLNVNIEEPKIIEKTFLKHIINVVVDNQDNTSNFLKCIYILKNYLFVIDKNSFKTLIKYSFFK